MTAARLLVPVLVIGANNFWVSGAANMGERIGVMTSGGDCPGLNAAVRAVVRCAGRGGAEVLGVRNGWQGLIEDDLVPLTRESVSGILPRGGTILGSTRTNPLREGRTMERVLANWQKHNLTALILMGGEGSLSAAYEVWRAYNLPLVCLPKTIDNDVRGTALTFGFYSAAGFVMEAVDRLHTTTRSHGRIMVVEVMGRHSGWLAAYGGLAGGADVVLVPERPFRISEVCEVLCRRHEREMGFSIVVVAEDAHPHPEENFLSEETTGRIYDHANLGGVGAVLAREIEARVKVPTRVVSLGYLQRGGAPMVVDRVLATRFGVKAYEMVTAKEWGRMAALRDGGMTSVPLEEAAAGIKELDPEILRVIEAISD
jgi:ATP-dependent phosphofructokinase / diphosphate-dependent phosphofructokinase